MFEWEEELDNLTDEQKLEQLEEDIKELQYIFSVKTIDDFREQGLDYFEWEEELDNLWEERDRLKNKLKKETKE